MPIFILTKAKLLIPLMAKNRYVALLLVVGLILALGWYIHHRIDKAGFERGVSETNAKHELVLKQIREMYQSRLDEQEKVRVALEVKLTTELEHVRQQHEVEIGRVKDEADLAIAKHVSGANRLSIQTVPARAAATQGTGTPSACPGDNGTAERRELAPEAAEFLIREAEYATALATRLRACQSTVQLYLDKTREYNEALLKQK